MKLSHSLTALNEAALQQAEASLGLNFPESYRQFLLNSNGGRLEDWRFGYDPDLAPEGYSFEEDAIEVSEFFGIGESTPSQQVANLLTQAKACHHALAAQGKHLPESWIWIARTADDDELFLSLSGPEAGSIYLLHARDEFFEEDFDELFDSKGQLEYPEDLKLSSDFQRFMHSASPA